jgi:hypothetical protein
MIRSIVAVLVGFVAVAGLSVVTDEILHLLQVYPPWGVTITDPRLFALALSYRIVFTVLGGWITARLAPRAPMRHVTVLAIIGLIGGAGGVAVAVGRSDLGPLWYPLAIFLIAYPCTWLGGKLISEKAV